MIFLRKICLAFDLVLVIYGSQLFVLWDNHILLVHASITEYSKPLFISAFEQKQARNSFAFLTGVRLSMAINGYGTNLWLNTRYYQDYFLPCLLLEQILQS